MKCSFLPGSGTSLTANSALWLCLCFFAVASFALMRPARAQAPAAAAPASATHATASKDAAADSPGRAYAHLIGKDAVTHAGVFLTHQVKEKLYWEIPPNQLGLEFLWTVRPVQFPTGTDGGGRLTGHVVRFQLHGSLLFIREVIYHFPSATHTRYTELVEAQNMGGLLEALPIDGTSPEGNYLVDVTRLFLGSGPLNYGSGPDPQRSFVHQSRAFPENVETEVTVTLSGGGGYHRESEGEGGGGGYPSSVSTFLLHYSLVRLPLRPMQARRFDDRVGFYSTRTSDYGAGDTPTDVVQFIERWRLEKKDSEASLSEPVKSIVFYLDPAMPARYMPYARKAVLAWNAAFEEAGFRNALVVKDAPTAAEDPDWSMDDIRNNVIRWLPSDTPNAMGPSLADPRTGEILNAQVFVYQNLLKTLADSYFVTAGPLDPRAATMPLPDDLMGELVEYALTHEVGHTLGLQHNMGASAYYPEAKLHDPAWLHSMGYAASIMDYARFDYVTQPEDHADVHDLIPRLGPYDRWAIHWGYTPIRGAANPAEESGVLDRWCREQENTPWLRFLPEGAVGQGIDPAAEIEVVGDEDSLAAARDGLKNLDRVAGRLLPATASPAGETFNRFKELYHRALNQREMEMGAVIRIVGGVAFRNVHTGETGPLFVPEPAAHQHAAVQFLFDNAFRLPDSLMSPEIVRVIGPLGIRSYLGVWQGKLLEALAGADRLNRMEETLLVDPKGYRPEQLLADVHGFVFRELSRTRPVRIASDRRLLQQTFVDMELNQARAAKGEAKELYVADLARTARELQAAQARGTDDATRAHLTALRTAADSLHGSEATSGQAAGR